MSDQTFKMDGKTSISGLKLDVPKGLDLSDSFIFDMFQNCEKELFSKDGNILTEDVLLSQMEEDCFDGLGSSERSYDLQTKPTTKNILPKNTFVQTLSPNDFNAPVLKCNSRSNNLDLNISNPQASTVKQEFNGQLSQITTQRPVLDNLKTAVLLNQNTVFLRPQSNVLYSTIQPNFQASKTPIKPNNMFDSMSPKLLPNEPSKKQQAFPSDNVITVQNMSPANILPVTSEQMNQVLMQVQATKVPVVNAPTIMYTTSGTLPDSGNSPKSVGIVNNLNTGTILATGIPVVLESDNLTVNRLKSFSPDKVPKVKEVKRNMHNAIERRYRNSINDRILELRDLIASPDAKMTKSSILRRTIEYIRYLQNTNAKLKQENIALKMASGGNINVSDMLVKDEDVGGITPPRSDVSSSPALSDLSNPPSPQDSSANNTYCTDYTMKDDTDETRFHGMLDQTRLALCAFMLSILVFNPFGLLVDRFSDKMTYGNTVNEGRTLLTVDGDNVKWIESSYYLWILNAIILVCCLVKLLVYGDTSVPTKSKGSVNFWRHRKQADFYLSQRNVVRAQAELKSSLSALSLPLPTSRISIYIGTIWQIIRQLLHRTYIGLWLSQHEGGFFLNQALRFSAQTSAKERAIVFYDVFKLTAVKNKDQIGGLMYILSAVNQAEAAGRVMSKHQLSEYYISLAIQIKHSTPKLFHIISRFYIWLAKSGTVASTNERLKWVFSPMAVNFIHSQNWSNSLQGNYIFTKVTDPLNPLAYIAQKYREQLLEQALSTLIAPTGQVELSSVESQTKAADVLQYIQVLLDDSSVRDKDSHSIWWASVLGAATYWLLGEDTKAEALYLKIENPPSEVIANPLAKSVLSAFRMKKMFYSMKHPRWTLKLASVASQHLVDSITVATSHNTENKELLIQLMVCDWLLETRTSLWESGHFPCSSTFLSSFHNDLLSLKKITQYMPSAWGCVFVYEATGRLIAGASPSRTQQLLDRGLRHRSAKSSMICSKEKSVQSLSREREHATALYLACKHLPAPLISSPGERNGMLLEAVKSLEKVGDKKRLQNCYQLMKSLGTTSITG